MTKRTGLLSFTSGIVITGFGGDEIFPKLRAFVTDGVIGGKLRFLRDRLSEISTENKAEVHAFAQFDMVNTFMEGIDPSYRSFIEYLFRNLLNDLPEKVEQDLSNFAEDELAAIKESVKQKLTEGLEEINQEMNAFQNEEFKENVIEIVQFLPKDELAEMAETLVNLTSFRQKLTPELATVGGPIDVAIISKGDGFIWVKRKHYFDPELNRPFFSKYFNS